MQSTPLSSLRRRGLASAALFAFLLSGCASAPPAPGPATAPVAGEVRTATQWFAASAEQEAAFRQTFRAATTALEQAVADLQSERWAVVLDADETVLDNVAYQVWLDRTGRSYSVSTWNDWVRREEAAALPGVVPFLHRVRALGGVIAIVSNRLEEVRSATESNLRKEGIPWDVMLLRTDTGDKGPRFRAIEEGTAAAELPPLAIVMWIGDNIQDFPGLTQSVRGSGAEAFADFGGRYFVVPNPTYGSWEDNPLPERLREP